MKKVLIAIFASLTFAANAQIVFNEPLHHLYLYGEMGECLFPMDGEDFAELAGIVECNLDAAQISDAIKAWFGRECFQYELEVNSDDKYITNRQLIFRAKMPVGHKLLFDGGTPAAFTGVSMDWDVSESDITFACKIDIKDNKFRYRFFQIEADRWRLKGEPETSGPVNDLHWQRVNCLTIKMERARSDSQKQVYQDMIDYEKYIYQQEYAHLKQLEKDLINCVKPDSENEEFDF